MIHLFVGSNSIIFSPHVKGHWTWVWGGRRKREEWKSKKWPRVLAKWCNVTLALILSQVYRARSWSVVHFAMIQTSEWERERGKTEDSIRQRHLFAWSIRRLLQWVTSPSIDHQCVYHPFSHCCNPPFQSVLTLISNLWPHAYMNQYNMSATSLPNDSWRGRNANCRKYFGPHQFIYKLYIYTSKVYILLHPSPSPSPLPFKFFYPIAAVRLYLWLFDVAMFTDETRVNISYSQVLSFRLRLLPRTLRVRWWRPALPCLFFHVPIYIYFLGNFFTLTFTTRKCKKRIEIA